MSLAAETGDRSAGWDTPRSGQARPYRADLRASGSMRSHRLADGRHLAAPSVGLRAIASRAMTRRLSLSNRRRNLVFSSPPTEAASGPGTVVSRRGPRRVVGRPPFRLYWTYRHRGDAAPNKWRASRSDSRQRAFHPRHHFEPSTTRRGAGRDVSRRSSDGVKLEAAAWVGAARVAAVATPRPTPAGKYAAPAAQRHAHRQPRYWCHFVDQRGGGAG